ncbi:type I-E CRISPR-associated endonuclease Cas1 [Corynebacterium pyruviciproducens]|uniref:type I-E CRISPR-associated endonuclease Cas1e n=1 Tax=Corynebacterium pyruviciproducens TaxID=598660 RepID=UPI002455C7EF|nr:type I-E CRISPR-associated endonuclease Cas1e [Corynebacterium pyruviciproducens]MDH4659182.1 type I-E CRISPR-associated endonuclease Cas1 [Corynebacterium pyruviciproducens]
MPTPRQLPLDRQALTRMEERISFLYVERAIVNRDANAITISDERGVIHIPATALAVLLLGPGTKITYAAMAILGDSGVSTCWVGEKGVRYYASGRPPAKTSRFAEIQATIVSNQRARLACARRMYAQRFPDDNVDTATMQQLRGREGARMKKIYLRESARTGVPWERRTYDPENFELGDPINKTLTAANAALYGITHAVICGLGFVPALGVVHMGTDRAFVYDIADLYKADITIPCAFDAVAADPMNAPQNIRGKIRDKIVETKLLPRMVNDLYSLMNLSDDEYPINAELFLWNEISAIRAGQNWADDEATK